MAWEFRLQLRHDIPETPEVRAWLDACEELIRNNPDFVRRWAELETELFKEKD